jgi:hypothetical protein
MTWLYEQSTGALSRDGVTVATGYSGAGDGKNNPGMQDVPNVGPIPVGGYTIGEPHNTPSHGPFVMTLTPDRGNEMFGRSAFLMHGDSVSRPGTASQGCIIQARAIREEVAASGDNRLRVAA